MRRRTHPRKPTHRDRTSRDAALSSPVSSSRGRSVPLARFRREVVALLVAARTAKPRLDSSSALRLVVRWDRMVRLRHAEGKPPCNVADHILRYEQDKAVCPCGAPLTLVQADRDPSHRSSLSPSRARHSRDASRASRTQRASCRRCQRKARGMGRGRGVRRDESRWERAKAWRNREMDKRREDFAGMTHNVGEVTRAAAAGRVPRFGDLRPVRNPISRLVERDRGRGRVRDGLPRSAFAIPERRAWPIHNRRHALIALRYMREGKGNAADYPRVRRAIDTKYPGLRSE